MKNILNSFSGDLVLGGSGTLIGSKSLFKGDDSGHLSRYGCIQKCSIWVHLSRLQLIPSQSLTYITYYWVSIGVTCWYKLAVCIAFYVSIFSVVMERTHS